MNIGPFEVLVLFVFFLVPAYFVAKHAENKGYSFALFFVLFLFTWVVALIVALILPDKRATAG